MATLSPSPESTPTVIPPASSVTPILSSPPQSSTQPESSTPPQPSPPSPPAPSTQAEQLDANPPDSSTPSPPSPPPNAPAPSSPETPATALPVDSSPPPDTSVPPPSPPSSPPPNPISQQPPPSNPSPPPSSEVFQPPPQPVPPGISPPVTQSPPPLPPPSPPLGSPPSPPSGSLPISSPTPPASGGSPPKSSPTPPSSGGSPPKSSPTPPSSNPPASSGTPQVSSPPPSSKSPVNSPPSPASTPSIQSPPAPASHPPESSPSTPAATTPSTSPPSSTNTPPSDHVPSSPPLTPGTSSPASSDNSTSSSVGPPLPGGQTTTVQTSPSLPAQGSGANSPQTGKGSNGGVGSGGGAAIGVVVGVLMLGLIGLMALWIIKRKKRKSGANDAYIIPASVGSSPRSDVKLVVKTDYPSPPFRGGSSSDRPTDHGRFGQSKPWFTYQELSDATGGFSDQNVLGEGGFGCVYKGVLADGRVVAVKQLKAGGGQGEREFQAEVEIISRIHHRHLVSLVGYCIWESKRLLVYDYVPNNTLYFHLHGAGRPTMDWATRVKIASGAARGIAYLHEDCHPRVIHRDIKSSNILLDNNFEAQVADFGLARLAMDADTHVSTRVMGTFGYLAPEYATSGKLTEKSDVYSFGVVLLELITGRKPVDESQPLGDESVVEWARPLLNHVLETGEFEALVDPRLESNYIESEMFRMIEAAAACVRHSSSKRPRMGRVVRALDGVSDSGDLSNGLRVGESRMYDSAQQSAEIRWFRRVAFGSQDFSSEFFNQNSGYSFQSGQTSNLSGRDGNIPREHGPPSQNVGFSRPNIQQSANFPAVDITRSQHRNVDPPNQGNRSQDFL